jgi:hypothetical protein
VIYNWLRHRMPLGIDATIRYGLDIPGTKSDEEGAAVAVFRSTRGSTQGCRRHRSQTWPRFDPRRREPGASTTSTTSASRSRRRTTSRPTSTTSCGRLRVRLRLRPSSPRVAADALAPRARTWSCARLITASNTPARWSAGSRSALSHSAGPRRARSWFDSPRTERSLRSTLSAFMRRWSTKNCREMSRPGERDTLRARLHRPDVVPSDDRDQGTTTLVGLFGQSTSTALAADAERWVRGAGRLAYGRPPRLPSGLETQSAGLSPGRRRERDDPAQEAVIGLCDALDGLPSAVAPSTRS